MRLSIPARGRWSVFSGASGSPGRSPRFPGSATLRRLSKLPAAKESNTGPGSFSNFRKTFLPKFRSACIESHRFYLLENFDRRFIDRPGAIDITSIAVAKQVQFFCVVWRRGLPNQHLHQARASPTSANTRRGRYTAVGRSKDDLPAGVCTCEHGI